MMSEVNMNQTCLPHGPVRPEGSTVSPFGRGGMTRGEGLVDIDLLFLVSTRAAKGES